MRKIINIRIGFWKSVDMKLVEQYFNLEGETSIEGVLAKRLESYCKQTYRAEFLSSIKGNSAYKNL